VFSPKVSDLKDRNSALVSLNPEFLTSSNPFEISEARALDIFTSLPLSIRLSIIPSF